MVKVLFFLVKVSQTFVNSQMLMLRCSNPSNPLVSVPGAPSPVPTGPQIQVAAQVCLKKWPLVPSLQKHEVLGACRHRPSVMSQVAGCHQSHQNEDQRHEDLAPWTWTGHLLFFGIFKMTKSFKVILKQTKTMKNLWTDQLNWVLKQKNEVVKISHWLP